MSLQHIKNTYSNKVVIEWDIVNFCNQKCTYCAMSINPEVKWERINNSANLLNIANIIKSMQVPTVVRILGGEPSLHFVTKKLIEIVLNNPLIEVELFTNAMKYIELDNLLRPITVVPSYHPGETEDQLFIDNILKYSKKHVIQCSILLHKVPKYLNRIVPIIKEVEKLGSVEGIFPFNNKGEYLNRDYKTVYELLNPYGIFPKDFIKDGGIVNAIEIYTEGNLSAKGFYCTKTLFLIDIDNIISSEHEPDKAEVNLLKHPEILSGITSTGKHYCSNTNCRVSLDNVYNKERA